MNPTIQQQIVSEYLDREVSHQQACEVIENDFAGLIVFIYNMKALKQAKLLRQKGSLRFKVNNNLN